MNCNNCGAILDDDASFCLKCGEKVDFTNENNDDVEQNEKAKETKNGKNTEYSRKIYKICVAVIVLISVLICLLTNHMIGLRLIPNLTNTDENSAKNTLVSNGIIPVVEYLYNDEIDKGRIISTYPSSGSLTIKNSRLTVYVSKGPKVIYSEDSTISWNNVTRDGDDWSFMSPYIDSGVLYIDTTVSFGNSVSWEDKTGDGSIWASTTIGDDEIPISPKYQSRTCKKNKEQDVQIAIPLNNFDDCMPTVVKVRFWVYVNGEKDTCDLTFRMSWPNI